MWTDQWGQSTIMHLDFRPLTEVIGAEALGVDLSRSLGDNAFARIHRAWLDHGNKISWVSCRNSR